MANDDDKKPQRKLPPRDPKTGRFMKQENAERKKSVEMAKELAWWEKKRKKDLEERLDDLFVEFGLKEKMISVDKEKESIGKKLADLAKKHLDTEDKTSDKLREEEDILKDIDSAQELVNSTTGMQKDLAERILAEKERELEVSNKIKDTMGLTGGAMKSLNKLFGGALGNTEEILKNTEKRLKQLQKEGKLQDGLAGKMQGFGIVMSEIGKSLKSNLTDPMTYLMALLDNSKSITQFRNELGMSYKSAMGMRFEMTGIAAASGDVFINSKKVQEAFFTMSESLGFVADYSGQTLETMVNLEKRLGMAGKEAAEMTMLLKMQGDDTERIAENTFDSLTNSIKQGSVNITAKQVFKEIAQQSKSIQVSLGANPKAIGEAIIAAKQLGAELADIDQIAGSLLNFEESISAELEAELLTGKQLNLEKARSLALNNDFAGVAEEINKQGIDYNFMTTANRLEQEAAAKAIGVSRDKLAEITLQQKMQTMSAEDIKNQYGEGAYQQAKQLDAAQKFAEAVEKIKTLFVDVMTVLTPVIDGFAKIVDFASGLGGALTAAGGAIGAMFVYIPKLIKAFKIMKGLSIGEAIAKIWGSLTAKLGPIGIGLAAGATAGMIALIARASRPKMAAGGLAKPTPGGTDITVAEAGEAELITPVSKAAETLSAVTGGGGGGNDINYDKLASAMSNVNMNVQTNYSGYTHSNTQSSEGIYARAAKHSSNKTI